MPLVNVKLIEGVFTPTQIRRTTLWLWPSSRSSAAALF